MATLDLDGHISDEKPQASLKLTIALHYLQKLCYQLGSEWQ